MSFSKYTEVLSPVGNEQMLYAAVRSGADAVYLGAKDFSARRNAENFDDTALKNAIDYCHIRGVKVYLTLNILIKDSEMPLAVDLAKRAFNYGIDGVIIEDLGLADLLHRLIPDLPLHASTQMSVHAPAALTLLKAIGFKRVVAAREMSYTELKEFCKRAEELNIEVEVFVHGALCMAVSGQCELSAFLGSRSGNRGLCAGPCRLPFAVKNGTGYDLSLKDLSLFSHIKELCRIGVVSFKIEGRMKRPEYVAAATAACREALDNGYVSEMLNDILKNIFSRQGFTDGYFKGELGKNMFGIRTREDVTSANSAFPLIHEIYRGERQIVKINAEVILKENNPIKLILSDGKNTVSVIGEIPSVANNKAADYESLKQGIDKFGSTPYILREFKAEHDEGLFVRASELNELRRNATELLNIERSKVNRCESTAEYIKKNKTLINKKPIEIYARFENGEQIPKDLSGISAVIFPLEKDLSCEINCAELIVDIPRGIANESAIAKRLKLFKEKGFKTALCGNLSAVEIAKNEGFEVLADTGLNIYNSESAELISKAGAKGIVLSNEILLNDAVNLNSPIPKGIVAYGNIPLMLFRNCPLKNGTTCEKCDKNGVITDRKNTDFPVRCRMGYSELLNSVPIWLADRKSELNGLDFEVLYFTRESVEKVSRVINDYKKGNQCDTDYTRGLFYRGLI